MVDDVARPALLNCCRDELLGRAAEFVADFADCAVLTSDDFASVVEVTVDLIVDLTPDLSFDEDVQCCPAQHEAEDEERQVH